MNSSDLKYILIAGFIVIGGMSLLTFTYLQDRPPSIFLYGQYGDVITSSNGKCIMHIAGDAKNEGDITALGISIKCTVRGSDDRSIGFSGEQLGEIAPHKSKEFSHNSSPFKCPTSGADFSCEATCENCP